MKEKHYRSADFASGIASMLKSKSYEQKLDYLKKQLNISGTNSRLPPDYRNGLVKVATDVIDGHYKKQSGRHPATEDVEKKVSDYEKIGLQEEANSVRKNLASISGKHRPGK